MLIVQPQESPLRPENRREVFSWEPQGSIGPHAGLDRPLMLRAVACAPPAQDGRRRAAALQRGNAVRPLAGGRRAAPCYMTSATHPTGPVASPGGAGSAGPRPIRMSVWPVQGVQHGVNSPGGGWPAVLVRRHADRLRAHDAQPVAVPSAAGHVVVPTGPAGPGVGLA